jgi:hypothetical protein
MNCSFMYLNLIFVCFFRHFSVYKRLKRFINEIKRSKKVSKSKKLVRLQPFSSEIKRF